MEVTTDLEDPETHNITTTMGTFDSALNPHDHRTSSEEQTLSPKACPFHAEISGTVTERPSYSRFKPRLSSRSSVNEIDAVIAEFKRTKDQFAKHYFPFQTYEMKRKGGDAAVTLSSEDMDGDGDATNGSTQEKIDPDILFKKLERFEEQIQHEERKSIKKREIGNQKSEGIRKARIIVQQNVRFEGGDMRMNVDLFKRLGRGAPLLTVKETSELVCDKFEGIVTKRSKKVRLGYALVRRITRHQKVFDLHAKKLMKLYRQFLSALGKLHERLPIPSGLSNLGNTCFMNAALNVLFYTPAVNSFMKKLCGHSGVELALTFHNFCTDYTKKDVTCLLYETMRHLPEFGRGVQMCSHSFLLKFLSKLDKDLSCTSPLPNNLPDLLSSRFANYQRGKCKEMHSLFSGLIENVFTCSKCFGSWQNYSYWRTMDLPITDTVYEKQGVTYFGPNDFYNEEVAEEYRALGPDQMRAYTAAFKEWEPTRLTEDIPVAKQGSTLHMCLKYMLRANLMTANNTFECEHCHLETQHYKQSFLRHVGDVLAIHFQRYNESTGNKLNTYVECPETLDLDPYLESGSKYHLTGVINHYGSLNGGHYTAYVRVGSAWYLVNDSSVSKVESGTNLFQAAYVVTYVRE